MLFRRLISSFAEARYLLRAIGLDLINTLVRSRTKCERPKPVMRRSRWIALSRCTIHIMPCMVFSFLIQLNYNTLYLGPNIAWRRPNS